MTRNNEDTALIPVETGDNISALPGNLLEALSVIQEQNFVESEMENPGLYSQLFTFKHKLAFLKVGLFTGISDSLIVISGMILFNLALQKVLPMFEYGSLSIFNIVLAFIIVTLPYFITIYLAFLCFKNISGTISRKMAWWLTLGFTEGAVLINILLFVICFGLSTDFAGPVYSILTAWEDVFPFLNGLADFFWDHVRYAMARASWHELWTVVGVSLSLFIFIAIYSRINQKKFKLD